MIKHRPYIVEKTSTDFDCACYINPIGSYLCPKCWKQHKISGTGCMLVEASTAFTHDVRVHPTVTALCECGYRGELVPMHSELADAVSLLNRSNLVVTGVITGEYSENATITVQFAQTYDFKTCPNGFHYANGVLTGSGDEGKLIENFNIWAKLVCRK